MASGINCRKSAVAESLTTLIHTIAQVHVSTNSAGRAILLFPPQSGIYTAHVIPAKAGIQHLQEVVLTSCNHV